MPDDLQFRVRMEHKKKSPHILALRTLRTSKQSVVNDWPMLLACICSFRKKKFPWAPTLNRSPSKRVREWMRKTPTISEWLSSEKCLVSPEAWPRAIYPAFAPRVIPSPYEIANVDMNGRYATSERAFRNHLVLLLYCMGFSVPQIADGHACTERAVLQQMYAAVENLHQLPSYLLWASGTDFSRSVIPPAAQGVTLERRGKFVAAVQKNPFYADAKLLDQFISSPPYLSYLLYSSPKRMRLTKGCRIYRTSEATNESTKQK